MAPAHGYWGCFSRRWYRRFLIQDEDLGDEPPYGTVPGEISAQGRHEDYGEAAKVTVIWDLGVPTSGDSDRRGGV